jgi:hypothetical protein
VARWQSHRRRFLEDDRRTALVNSNVPRGGGAFESEMEDIRPELFAIITFYATENGGRRSPLRGDLAEWYGCPCRLDEVPEGDYRDCRMFLRGRIIWPGETHEFEMVFASTDTAEKIRRAGKFRIWEGRIIGEGVPIPKLSRAFE